MNLGNIGRKGIRSLRAKRSGTSKKKLICIFRPEKEKTGS
jgi:hypothetical protein